MSMSTSDNAEIILSERANTSMHTSGNAHSLS